MEMIGQTVQHKTLGEGTVEAANGKYLSIRFGCGVKTFVYPDTFGKFFVAAHKGRGKRALRDGAFVRSVRERHAQPVARRREKPRGRRRNDHATPGKSA